MNLEQQLSKELIARELNNNNLAKIKDLDLNTLNNNSLKELITELITYAENREDTLKYAYKAFLSQKEFLLDILKPNKLI